MEVGAADAAIAVAQNLKELPGELRARLNSEDPTVRGEALVDTLAIAGASTTIVSRLQQTSGNAITVSLERQAAPEFIRSPKRARSQWPVPAFLRCER